MTQVSCRLLDQLRKFIVVAEELSFTRASRRLHIVQSGVSSAIQALERELGAVLFDRDRHRVALTDAGQALLPRPAPRWPLPRRPRMRSPQASAGLRGTLTVGTMTSTGPVDLPRLLGRFHASHPEVAVHLRQAASGSDGLARQVIAGELDLALLALPGQPPGGLRLRPVSEERLVLISPRAIRWPGARRRAGPAGRGDLRGLPARLGEPDRGRPRLRRGRAGPQRPVRGGRLRVGGRPGPVRPGRGVHPVTAAAEFPGVCAVELASPALTWRMSVATPTARRLSAAARAFLAELPGDQSTR